MPEYETPSVTTDTSQIYVLRLWQDPVTGTGSGGTCQPPATYKAKTLILEASMNREKVGFELSAEIPGLDVGVYINIEERFFAGAQKPPTPKGTFLTGQGIVNPERIPKFGETGNGTISPFGGGAGVTVGRVCNAAASKARQASASPETARATWVTSARKSRARPPSARGLI